MVERSFDPEKLHEAIAPYPEIVGEDFDVEEWLEDPNNVLLEEGGSCGIFEFEYPGVYCGHYFFKVRGKEAFDLAQRMLNDIFLNHGAKVIKGLTPIEKKGALYLTRKLGFESYGTVDTWVGPHEIFFMSIDQFFHNLNKDI